MAASKSKVKKRRTSISSVVKPITTAVLQQETGLMQTSELTKPASIKTADVLPDKTMPKDLKNSSSQKQASSPSVKSTPTLISSATPTSFTASVEPATPAKPSHMLSYLLFAVSIIFYVLAIFALKQALSDPSYYRSMFFLILDGILFATAGLFVRARMEGSLHAIVPLH